MSTLAEQCADELSRMPEVRVAFLYGSRAAGAARSSSDIDIAVAADTPLSMDARLDIARRVAERTGHDVDVIDLQSVSGVILHQALTQGKPLFIRDRELYASIMKRMLFNQADMMPYYRRILTERRIRFLHDR